MKACYFSTYYFKDYVRTKVILEGLKRNGVTVLECIENGKNPLRYIKALLRFIKIEKEIDIVIVGFRGHEILHFVRALTKKPIVFDAFISVYETLCFDMEKIAPKSLFGKLVFWYEKKCLGVAQKILLDTDAQIDYFAATFGISPEKFCKLYVGADSQFFPRKKKCGSGFLVLWYGNYIPLQGAEFIIEAAKLLSSEKDVKFRLIGSGQTFQSAKNLALGHNSGNVEFLQRVDYERLPEEMAACDVFLGGHFGESHKAKSVISGKAFQAMAMGLPIIVGKNPATRELFSDKKNCLMVEHANAKMLAQAIMKLKNNAALRERIAKGARSLFLDKAAPEKIGKEIKALLEGIDGQAAV